MLPKILPSHHPSQIPFYPQTHASYRPFLWPEKQDRTANKRLSYKRVRSVMIRQAYERLDHIFGREQKILLLFLKLSAVLVNWLVSFWTGLCHFLSGHLCVVRAHTHAHRQHELPFGSLSCNLQPLLSTHLIHYRLVTPLISLFKFQDPCSLIHFTNMKQLADVTIKTVWLKIIKQIQVKLPSVAKVVSMQRCSHDQTVSEYSALKIKKSNIQRDKLFCMVLLLVSFVA